MKKINFLLFFIFIAFACEKDELCNSSIGTLIIENNLDYVSHHDYPGEIELICITVHVYMLDEPDQIWNYSTSEYIPGKYHVFQFKEGKYRIEALWESNKYNVEIELFINESGIKRFDYQM